MSLLADLEAKIEAIPADVEGDVKEAFEKVKSFLTDEEAALAKDIAELKAKGYVIFEAIEPGILAALTAANPLLKLV